MLDHILAVLVVILPTLFAVVLEAVSKEIREHPYWRIGVLTFGIGLSALTWLQISRADAVHDHEQKDLEGKLDQSLLAQQYTKGQLDSLSLMVGKLGQPNPQGTEIATAIKQMAQATAQNAADLKASNTELCNRAHALAEKIRVFQGIYDKQTREADVIQNQRQRLAKTDEERHNLLMSYFQAKSLAEQQHDTEFRSKYMPEGKYLRDLLMSRMPPKVSETLINNNGQADGNLITSTISGAFNEYVTATYLDELANAVCPQTAEQKKGSR